MAAITGGLDTRAEGWETGVTVPFKALLERCLRLSDAEKRRLMAALGTKSLEVRLQAWCDGYEGPSTEVLPHSSPPPLACSYPVLPWCPEGNEDQALSSSKEAAVAGCPWCRRPLVIIGSSAGRATHVGSCQNEKLKEELPLPRSIVAPPALLVEHELL